MWSKEILGNDLLTWSMGVLATLVTYILLIAIRDVVVVRLKKITGKTRIVWDDMVIDILGQTKKFLIFGVCFYAGSFFVELPIRLQSLIEVFAVVSVLIQGCLWGNGVIGFWIKQQKLKAEENNTAVITSSNLIGFIARVILYSVALLLVLDNLGIDVTALVASLGIGGVAVALSVQNILADLFACLSISLDKPFVVGDFIIVGDLLGTVEHTGLKTTRVRSLSGEQLVFSNNDLLNSRIRNFKRMYERRVVFAFGVVYQTPAEVLKEIPVMIRGFIEAEDQTRFDRAHFKGFGNSSLDFEVVYYVLAPDYNLYMDIQQQVNLAMVKTFNEKGIDFAYPTRTLYMENSED